MGMKYTVSELSPAREGGLHPPPHESPYCPGGAAPPTPPIARLGWGGPLGSEGQGGYHAICNSSSSSTHAKAAARSSAKMNSHSPAASSIRTRSRRRSGWSRASPRRTPPSSRRPPSPRACRASGLRGRTPAWSAWRRGGWQLGTTRPRGRHGAGRSRRSSARRSRASWLRRLENKRCERLGKHASQCVNLSLCA